MTLINRPAGFIYLKSHKTASSSIESFLIVNLKLGNDIYYTSKDLLKINSLDYNKNKKKIYCLPLTNYFFDIPSRFYLRGTARFLPHVREHQPGSEVKKLVGSNFWDTSVKSTSIRNPWDALVSFYNWVKVGRYGRGFPTNVSWSDFLDHVLTINTPSSMSLAQEYLIYPYLYIEQGENFLNHVFYFEDLAGSINELKELLGLNPSLGTNKIYRFKVNREDRDYRTYYTDKQAERVKNHFQKFLADYHYSFDKINERPG